TAARMSGYRDRDQSGHDRACGLAFEEIGGVRRGGPVVAMDPHARAEPLCVFARVCNIVPVREKDVRDTAGVLEPLHELHRMAWRIDEEVATRARDEVGVRPEGRARVEPTAPHAVGDLLGKDRRLRPRLLHFAAYRRGWTH